MRHRTGTHRPRPHLAARLPLYVLVLGLQLSVGASLMGGAGAAESTVRVAHQSAPGSKLTPRAKAPSPATVAPAPVSSPATPRPAATPAASPQPRGADQPPRMAIPSWILQPAVTTATDEPPAQVLNESKRKMLTVQGAKEWLAAEGNPATSGVKKPAERKPALKPAAKRPVAKKPVAKKAPVKKPAAKSTIARPRPAVAAVRKPAVRKPAVRKPAVRRPVATRPAPKKPVAKKPSAKKPAPKKPAAKRPATNKPAKPTAKRRVERWLPSGTGMWTNKWEKTSGGNPRRVVRTALQQNVTHIFVKTGTLRGGFDGAPVLARILPATRGTNIKVIAWDFPMLRDPLADAARLAAAAKYNAGPGMPRVAAVAPDIETRAEGTRLTTGGVVVYYRELRRLLPPDVAILATVPWPSEKRVGKYPYAVTAQFADAFIPMAYWFNRSPAAVTQQSIRYLERFGRPVMPAGMAYDPDLDAPRLNLATPKAKDLASFATASRKAGARAISFWAWQTASPDQWQGIRQAALGFPKPSAPGPVAPPDNAPGVAIPVGVVFGGPFDRPY